MEQTKTSLDLLKELSTLVCDTADVEQIKKIKPTDSTTNPTLIVKAISSQSSQLLLKEAIKYAEARSDALSEKEWLELVVDKVIMLFGKDILQYIEGYVSTEVDARISFDVDASVARAKRIISLYEEEGISRDRVLIKLASSWEGIQAAKELMKDGIKCNMTLIMNTVQATACGDAGVFLISPFVGRLTEAYAKKYGKTYSISEDPGVLGVKIMHNIFQKKNLSTIIMVLR